MPSHSNRHLPHRDLGRHPVHLIYRLEGSIPKAHLLRLQDWYETEIDKLEQAYPLRKSIAQEQAQFKEDIEQLSFEYEQNYDQLLDDILGGPTWLKDKKFAEIVSQSLLDVQEMNPIIISAYCIMPNHVHIILQATIDKPISLGKLIGSHKKFTARRCNKILDQTGAFWNSDFFDRDIRPGKFLTVLHYVLHNPVKAKLVSKRERWPYSYLNSNLQKELFDADVVNLNDSFLSE